MWAMANTCRQEIQVWQYLALLPLHDWNEHILTHRSPVLNLWTCSSTLVFTPCTLPEWIKDTLSIFDRRKCPGNVNCFNCKKKVQLNIFHSSFIKFHLLVLIHNFHKQKVPTILTLLAPNDYIQRTKAVWPGCAKVYSHVCMDKSKVPCMFSSMYPD